MDVIATIGCSILGVIVILLLIQKHEYKKQIKEIKNHLDNLVNGQSTGKLFSKKEDELGEIVFRINQLATLYSSEKKKYQNEQMTKKRLIANLSHDVRTPLVSVIGYLEAIIQKRIEEEQTIDYIMTAYQKSLVLKEQVNQLFEFAQSDAGEIQLCMEQTDVCEIVRRTIIDFLPTLEKNHMQVDISIPDEEIICSLDRDSFIRILQNIIKNVIAHGKEGKYIGILIHDYSDKVYIDISDKGKGIGKEHLDFVFERLYKAEMSRNHTGGLGLAIAKDLANKMNGDVEIVHSVPGDTVFRITFNIIKELNT